MTAKFIKVTEVHSDGSTLPLVLNTAFITSIKKAKQGRDTMINIAGERSFSEHKPPVYFFVKETVDEVGAML